MERGLLELALLALVVVNACSFVRAHGAGPPNVVFIVVDDLGWDDVGCQCVGTYDGIIDSRSYTVEVYS